SRRTPQGGAVRAGLGCAPCQGVARCWEWFSMWAGLGVTRAAVSARSLAQFPRTGAHRMRSKRGHQVDDFQAANSLPSVSAQVGPSNSRACARVTTSRASLILSCVSRSSGARHAVTRHANTPARVTPLRWVRRSQGSHT
ncbi:unnamed protein product, partial [Amoebophrya sp. A25]